jgi:hypothetical protein
MTASAKGTVESKGKGVRQNGRLMQTGLLAVGELATLPRQMRHGFLSRWRTNKFALHRHGERIVNVTILETETLPNFRPAPESRKARAPPARRGRSWIKEAARIENRCDHGRDVDIGHDHGWQAVSGGHEGQRGQSDRERHCRPSGRLDALNRVLLVTSILESNCLARGCSNAFARFVKSDKNEHRL